MPSSSFSLNNVAAAINIFTLLCTLFFLAYRKFRSHQETKTAEKNKTVGSSSLVPLSLPRNWKHHVFPSFHGADVRRSLLSHILKEFRCKAIDLFIDNNIERSKSIGPELIEAIRGSRIAIVLLSKNYASSTWCLDELVEIIRCRDELDQTVMVLFYEVEPTDVKKQTGEFGKVFWKTCKGKTNENIGRWKQALAEVAKIAGYHSTNWDDEAQMIETIAIDVSNKLNNSSISSDFDGLVGMESHMINMGSLLRLDLEEVRVIGIWGPSGIGKTTIARFLFSQHSQNFQLSIFMENIRESYPVPTRSDDYSVKKYLQEQFMSKIINHEGFRIQHLESVKDRLKDKKVLVVLDDVDHAAQLEAMAKETCWFGPSSRIIITTQDRRLLRAHGVYHTYKVDFPSSDEAFQMFCMHAFDQKSPKDGFEGLAWEVTELAGKLPLGLRIMGSYFRGMPVQDWWKALPRLRTSLDGKIESILKFSYDALCDEDQNLFLHIACFFTNESVSTVEGCLANSLSVPNVTHGLQVLAEKSLISLDNQWIGMHNLLLRLGKEIMRKQYVSEPWKPRILDDTRDIDKILSIDKADTCSVIGMDLHFPQGSDQEEICTSEKVFERFHNLHFLRVDGYGANVYFSQSRNSLSPNLRLLTWNDFNMPCFPSSFQTKFLVKLDMECSNLEKLWEGVQPLGNLKVMDLTDSRRLIEVPDLSTATNLCALNLHGCSSLVELPSSLGKAINLQKFNLGYCSSLVKLPCSIGNLTNLLKLNLTKCSSLVELPSSIGKIINLQDLKLMYCSSLVKLPSSIENAIYLQRLDLNHCFSSLMTLPFDIEKGTNLGSLDLVCCSSLVKLPSSIGNAKNLQELNLDLCTSLVELPSSIGNAINLRKLSLYNCRSLVELPTSIGDAINLQTLDCSGCSSLVGLPSSMKNLGRLSKLELKKCSKLEVCLTYINLESLEELDLSYCSLLKSDPETSTSIEDLKPGGTTMKEVSYCETQELGPWNGRISCLRRLVLTEMQKLASIPQLPYTIQELVVVKCESLERLDCSFHNPDICLIFLNCFKLNQEARDLIIQTPTNGNAVLPGEEVPACFTYRASGSSLTVKLNQKPLRTSIKFKACILLAVRDYEYSLRGNVEVHCSITSKQNVLTVCRKTMEPAILKHLYTFEVEAMEVTSTELLFEFELRKFNKFVEIKECGILQILEVPSC